MVFVQKWLFFQTFFLANIVEENAFYNILQRKISFLRYKIKKFKKSENWHFSKRVNPWFWSKHCHFLSTFFFRQYRQGKCLIRYSRTKKTFFFAIKATSSKRRKIDIFTKGLTHGFCPKMTIIPTCFSRKYR